jgi:hypothetical protein
MKKLASKIVMGAALTAVALTTLAGSVQAGEMETKATLGFAKIDVETPSGDADGNAVVLGLEGSYGLGFSYDIEVMDGDIGGDYAAGDFDAQYLWNGKLGVAFGFDYQDIDDKYSDRFSVGLAGETNLENLTLSGKVLSDVDEFGEHYELTLGAEFMAAPNTTVSMEAGQLYDGQSTDFGSVAAEYKLANGMGLEAEFFTSKDEADTKVKAIALGVNMSF